MKQDCGLEVECLPVSSNELSGHFFGRQLHGLSMKFASKPIHAFSNCLLAKNPPLEFGLSWHIRQHDSQQYRKQTGCRSQEHDDAKDQESNCQQIFQNADRYADHRRFSIEPVIALRLGKEVIGHPDNEPGRDNQKDK